MHLTIKNTTEHFTRVPTSNITIHVHQFIVLLQAIIRFSTYIRSRGWITLNVHWQCNIRGANSGHTKLWCFIDLIIVLVFAFPQNYQYVWTYNIYTTIYTNLSSTNKNRHNVMNDGLLVNDITMTTLLFFFLLESNGIDIICFWVFHVVLY